MGFPTKSHLYLAWLDSANSGSKFRHPATLDSQNFVPGPLGPLGPDALHVRGAVPPPFIFP